MSYPQPDADQAVVKGQQYFRLNTLLASPGDIYESSQGANAMAIGPDSDISEVLVTYPDPTQPTGLNQFVVSSARSFTGLVPVNNNGQVYLPANRPGKIYMSPNNLWNPDILPTSGTQAVILETPRLDVIEYFRPQQSLVSTRRDKTYTYQSVVVPSGVGSTARICVPFYGRKYASVVFEHNSGPGGGPSDVTVGGLVLTYGDQAGNTAPFVDVPLVEMSHLTSAIGSNIPYTFVVGPAGLAKLQTDGGGSGVFSLIGAVGGGSFDLLYIEVTRGATALSEFFCEITVSDIPASFGGTIAVGTP